MMGKIVAQTVSLRKEKRDTLIKSKRFVKRSDPVVKKSSELPKAIKIPGKIPKKTVPFKKVLDEFKLCNPADKV